MIFKIPSLAQSAGIYNKVTLNIPPVNISQGIDAFNTNVLM